MRAIVFLLISFLLVSGAKAQDRPDPVIFTNPVFISPRPPKAVKGWSYVEKFQPGEAALVGEYPGKIIKFQFKGTAVGIAAISNSDAGTVEFSIDNEEWQKLDMYSNNTSVNQLKYFTLGTQLKNRKHILQLRTTQSKSTDGSGGKCILRYFYLNDPK